MVAWLNRAKTVRTSGPHALKPKDCATRPEIPNTRRNCKRPPCSPHECPAALLVLLTDRLHQLLLHSHAEDTAHEDRPTPCPSHRHALPVKPLLAISCSSLTATSRHAHGPFTDNTTSPLSSVQARTSLALPVKPTPDLLASTHLLCAAREALPRA